MCEVWDSCDYGETYETQDPEPRIGELRLFQNDDGSWTGYEFTEENQWIEI